LRFNLELIYTAKNWIIFSQLSFELLDPGALKMTKTVLAAALGECVHVAGVSNFLNLAESAGWRAVFLGPAVSIETLLAAARCELAGTSTLPAELLIGVSYRLTPENGERLLGQFAEAASDLHATGVRFVFGGTPLVAEHAKRLGFFEKIFAGGESPEQVLAYLKGKPAGAVAEADYPLSGGFPQLATERIEWRAPYPILRHHFGLPTMAATLEGIQKIAEAQALDLISLGTDQDAQENFFHPERQDPRRKISAPCTKPVAGGAFPCSGLILARMILSAMLKC
jgi:hypothetical protein